MDGNPSIEELNRKLELLSRRQQQFQQEIADLRQQIAQLNPYIDVEPIIVTKQELPADPKPLVIVAPPVNPAPPVVKKKKEKTPLEEFIGTNLLNKIGIAVLIIGVGIGVEYAIDHDLISPVTRIVLGYLCGAALIGVAIRLKAKYAPFSAVLLSGGMAVLYFITFAAYNLYALFPRTAAFVIMLVFTAFTVFAALQYAMQVIAIIGLVGAYGVPFLLSNGSGNVAVLFSYMTIVNTGILFLGFKKSWRLLNYIAFSLTWIIFAVWSLGIGSAQDFLWTELIFSTIFFVTFYAAILAYKIIRGEALTKKDISVVLLNSFVYYGFGYFAIQDHDNGEIYLGVFTVFNAVLHFIVCLIIYKSQAQSKSIFLFAAGLVLVFLTLAVPVQLEGNWVTIVWAGEALLMFWIGRTKGYPGYEKLSYPLIALALGSLFQDWENFYGRYYTAGDRLSHVTSFLNIQLLTSLLVCAAIAMIIKINRNTQFPSPIRTNRFGNMLLEIALPIVWLLTLFLTFYFEVATYWDQRLTDSQLSTFNYGERQFITDYDVSKFKGIWVMIYTASFVLVLGAVNYFKLREKNISYVVLALGSFVVFLLVTVGLTNAAELRYSYLYQTNATYYYRDIGHLLIRYVIIAFALMGLYMNHKTSQQLKLTSELSKAERLFFHFVILAIISSELISGLALMGITESDKLALSVLWGVYAVALIVYGLIKDLKFLRIAAISLFGVTLIKLFFYDLNGMGTIAKTLVMIILGVLLLVASFLYNKFEKKGDEKME